MGRQLVVPLLGSQVCWLIVDIKRAIVNPIRHQLFQVKENTSKSRISTSVTNNSKKPSIMLTNYANWPAKGHKSQSRVRKKKYLAFDSDMQLLEGFTLGHGRVEADLVKDRPMSGVIVLKVLYPILGTADLGVDTLGRDVDSSHDIHGAEVCEEEILNLQEILFLGDRSELVIGKGDIVLGRWVRGPLDVVTQNSSVDLDQSVGSFESERRLDLDAPIREDLTVWR